MKVYKKAILPIGFKANGVASGIKKSGKLDLAIFYSDVPAKAACKFTTNKIAAWPIRVNKRHLKENRTFQAIIANSGNANCFTGKQGKYAAERTSKIVSQTLAIKRESVLLASTGIIGRPLPAHKIEIALPDLILGMSKKGIEKAKFAIMTTDTFAKVLAARFNIGNKIITICGVAKGAGMVAPNLATMLVFILTDCNITQRALDKALGFCVNNSFNCITVDGCMSTNDSLMMLANACAQNPLIDINRHFHLFLNALGRVCLELAKMIIRDAEGASKFIQLTVKGARDFKEARTIALSIANSALFKTAMYGENPNFGRIVSAIGASGVDVKEEELKIKVSSLKKKDISVNVSVNRGNSEAVVYTSDLTPEYIKINAEYN